MSEDKAIHTLYEKLKTGNFMCVVPYGDKGRYATYYAEDRLYLVLDLWYHGLFLVEAKSPRDAIDQVNCDRLAYFPGIDSAPTIDAVSVVRCKECWHGTDMKNGKEFCIRCDIMDDLLMLADGYCNFGERKESE